MSEMSISYKEGTTREVVITCLDEQGEEFILEGYTAQAHISFLSRTGGRYGVYLDVETEENVVSFIIPAALSVGMMEGVAEVRIFGGNGEVLSVICLDIEIDRSKKPDIAYHGGEEEEDIL